MDEAYKIEYTTLEKFEALPEGTKAELVNGVVYDMAPPSTRHQIISGNLFLR